MKLEFIDEQHEAFFKVAPGRFNFLADDVERLALFYLLGLMPELRKNIDLLYDTHIGGIRPEGLHAPFQTSGTSALTKLAFILYNNYQEVKLRYPDRDEDEDDNFTYYTSPSLLNIFAPLDRKLFPFLHMAIDLRFGLISEI